VSRPRYRLTEVADEDIENILRQSARQFGPLQRDKYASLIEKALDMVAVDPERPGSRDRSDLAHGLRSFRLELAAGRRGAASHALYYLRDEQEGLIIVRVLHDAMEPALHIDEDLDRPESRNAGR
jgi:toxin ParE1/3/4